MQNAGKICWKYDSSEKNWKCIRGYKEIRANERKGQAAVHIAA